MKIIPVIIRNLFLSLLVFLAVPRFSGAQPPASAIKNMIDSGNYVFQAQSALPMSGRVRQLTTDYYTLKVSPEKITSDLPYFGRAYTAPIDPTQTGLQFTTKDFDYKITPRKKEGWNIVIKPKDYKEVQTLQLTISSAGYATLQVISANRQTISFNGIVIPPPTPPARTP